MQTDSEFTWHDDGHFLELKIEKTELVITGIHCPHADENAKCHVGSEECIVRWFVQRFGMECNVGICAPAPKIQIAWALAGDFELGLDTCQVWIIPTTDDFFSAWAATQKAD